MCGRYSLDARPQEIAEAFALAEAIELEPRYNIAPTQSVPVVRRDQASRFRPLDIIRWGLARRRFAWPSAAVGVWYRPRDSMSGRSWGVPSSHFKSGGATALSLPWLESGTGAPTAAAA